MLEVVGLVVEIMVGEISNAGEGNTRLGKGSTNCYVAVTE